MSQKSFKTRRVPGDSGQDDSSLQGWRDEFLLSILVLEEDEDVHGADLGDRVVRTVEPQALLAVVTLRYFL